MSDDEVQEVQRPLNKSERRALIFVVQYLAEGAPVDELVAFFGYKESEQAKGRFYINSVLGALRKRGLVADFYDDNDRLRWCITDEGRALEAANGF